jgi:uncharacterized DUF497 family protein
MEIAFDPEKDAANIAKHGLSLADFKGFESEPQLRLDDRYDYAEIRYRAYGRIAGRGFCVVFTMRAATMRVISFRRAHDKEMRRYE